MAGVEQGQGAQTIIRPQPGPQTTFLASTADIGIYGGSAGGGKTWALLMEPLRHVANPQFGAVFFRRTLVQVRNEGGLWDESEKLYPSLNAKPKVAPDLSWTFPAGSLVSFAHLEHDKTVSNWQGSQIPLICFDELTHFSAKQFWYLLSRNRSMCGVRPYVRATCNPDADSWVAEFISWWINQDTGLPIPERAGLLRWFVRIGDAIIFNVIRIPDFMQNVGDERYRAKIMERYTLAATAKGINGDLLLDKEEEFDSVRATRISITSGRRSGECPRRRKPTSSR
ncbi:Terminase-like family protein [Sinorhizobium sp. NFACC03]|nr:Terminase-like family protein [Sinorhizobium sp. NFACC03]